MMIILTPDYVTKDRPYANGFIHTRVKSYIKNGIEAKVFVLDEKRSKEQYTIDEVQVEVGGVNEFVNMVDTNEEFPICVHFVNSTMVKAFERISRKLNLLFFVHGNEALHWYQRIFPGIFSNVRQGAAFCKYVIVNINEMKSLQHFFSHTGHFCSFIAVSEWMKEKAEATWKCKGKYTWNIIPNYIDSSLFLYNKKGLEDKKRLLSIRPFTSGKYANDVTAKMIFNMSNKAQFSELKFTWVGNGRLYKKTIRRVSGFENVNFIPRMLQQSEIPGYHAQNGIFICPTRQDAQGVSMCEAMASGLVPVTLYNTAIPEFLPDDDNLICNSVSDMERLVWKLVNNQELFEELSIKCSEFVREKCSYEKTIEKELSLLKAMHRFREN